MNLNMDLNDLVNQALVESSISGHSATLQLLLSDPRINPKYDTFDEAICKASRKGHDNVVAQLLLDPKVDPSRNNNEAIR